MTSIDDQLERKKWPSSEEKPVFEFKGHSVESVRDFSSAVAKYDSFIKRLTFLDVAYNGAEDIRIRFPERNNIEIHPPKDGRILDVRTDVQSIVQYLYDHSDLEDDKERQQACTCLIVRYDKKSDFLRLNVAPAFDGGCSEFNVIQIYMGLGEKVQDMIENLMQNMPDSEN